MCAGSFDRNVSVCSVVWTSCLCVSDHHERTVADAEEDASVSKRAQQGRTWINPDVYYIWNVTSFLRFASLFWTLTWTAPVFTCQETVNHVDQKSNRALALVCATTEPMCGFTLAKKVRTINLWSFGLDQTMSVWKRSKLSSSFCPTLQQQRYYMHIHILFTAHKCVSHLSDLSIQPISTWLRTVWTATRAPWINSVALSRYKSLIVKDGPI